MQKKFWLSGLVIIFGLCLGLGLVEITLRLVPTILPLEIHSQLSQKVGFIAPVGLPQFLAEYRAIWEEDDFLRERLKPNVDTIIHGNPEYPAWPVKTDSLGLGPAGYRDTRPKAEPYAVVLGDSFGFGVGVAQEEVWSEQVERQTGLAFVNLSQVGASSLQEARIYARYGRQFSARVVFWMFFQNDLKDNLRFAQWLEPEVNITQAIRRPTWPCQGLLHHSLKRYTLTYELLIYWPHICEYSAMPPTPAYQDERLSLVFCLDHDICDMEVQARMLADGWPLTRQALKDTLAQTKQSGAELIIMIVPSKEQVYWPQFQQVASLPPGHNIDRLVEPVREFCVAENVRCIDLTEAFRAQVDIGPQRYFPIDIHWNASGHTLVADVAGDYLRQEGLLP